MSGKLHTFEQWNKHPCEFEVGDRLDKELVEHFFHSSMYPGCYLGHKSIGIYEGIIAFQHSEAYGDAYVRRKLSSGDVLYRTYAKIHGDWYYMGICFEGEMIDRSDLDQ